MYYDLIVIYIFAHYRWHLVGSSDQSANDISIHLQNTKETLITNLIRQHCYLLHGILFQFQPNWRREQQFSKAIVRYALIILHAIYHNS